jgi:tRNA nucleotidyltransferase/poly(A) polymerase
MGINLQERLRQNPIFSVVSGIARDKNLETYVVGGWVRDQLLRRESKDIDFVCVGSGIELARRVAGELGNAPLSVFRNFGTAMVKTGDVEYEFVGARKESYQKDSRKPRVEDGTLEDDQLRRDFTVNALAISLNEKDFGQLVDPFDGISDLKRKIIRTPTDPDKTFSDDPLRMMRAIRFAAQLGFDIEADTFASIIQNANRLKIISAERIITELNKVILTKKPSYGFNLLFHAGLLQEFFPEMVALQGVEHQEGKGHKDNF